MKPRRSGASVCNLRRLARALAGAALAALALPSGAQVVFDGTLGSAGPLTGPEFIVPVERGRQLGGNLFHSFSAFSIAQGQSAVFTGPTTVQNILARVTGGSVSTIDGRLRSTIPAANLYLINPSGVVFGPHASIDVGGSFHVSTADYLRLGTDGRFAATQPGTSVLTVAPPAAFGFLAAAPAPIVLNGTRLTTAPGAKLTLAGGDVVALANEGIPTRLTARGGKVELLSVGSPGEANPEAPDFSASTFDRLGHINLLSGTLIDVSAGEDAGAIVLRGGRVSLDGARLEAQSLDGGRGGAIEIFARGALTIGGVGHDQTGAAVPSHLLTVTRGALPGRAITISADALHLTDGARLQSTTVAAGEAGPIRLTAREVSLAGGALVSNDTRGSGGAGEIVVAAADALTLSGASRIQNLSSAAGQAGDLFLGAREIALTGGSVALNQSLAEGDAGALAATADVIRLQDASAILGHARGAGRGASVSLRAREIVVQQGSWVGADTYDRGRGGDIDIRATDALTLNGFVTARRHGSGDGGSVVLHAGALAMDQGAQVSAAALPGSAARGGDIEIEAATLSLAGASTIVSRSDSAAGAGRIRIRSPSVSIVDAAHVLVQTGGDGDGGSLEIDTERLTLASGGSIGSETWTSGLSRPARGPRQRRSDRDPCDGVGRRERRGEQHRERDARRRRGRRCTPR
jgi:filamentous hemagglutinin family protein